MRTPGRLRHAHQADPLESDLAPHRCRIGPPIRLFHQRLASIQL